MPEYDPRAISAAMARFTEYLLSTAVGIEVWEMLHKSGIRISPQMDWFTYGLGQADRRDEFERLQTPPYVYCLKKAASRINQNLRLRYKDFSSHVPHEIVFEHTPEGIQIRRTPENIRDI